MIHISPLAHEASACGRGSPSMDSRDAAPALWMSSEREYNERGIYEVDAFMVMRNG